MEKLTCDHCGKKDCKNCIKMDGRNFCCKDCLKKCKEKEATGSKEPANVCKYC